MDTPTSFAEAALLNSLALLTSERAIDLAARMLIEGIELPSVLELAAMTPADDYGWQEVFGKVLRELGIEGKSPKDSAFELVLQTSRDIGRGRVDAIDGAKFIWQNLWQPWCDERVTPFVAMLDELEDQNPPTREELAGEIRDYAKSLLHLYSDNDGGSN